MSINKRIIEYLDFKGISQRSFSKRMGLSEGILRRGNNIGSAHFKKIKELYPDLNINWVLLFENEDMLTNNPFAVNEPKSNYQIKTKNELISLQREQIILQKKLLKAKEAIIKLTSEINSTK